MLVRRNCLRGRRWAAVAVVWWMILCGRLAAAADRVEAARAVLAQQAGRPEAVAAIADLLLREDLIAPSRMAEVLRDLVDGRAAAKTDPLVLAQATYRLSLQEDRLGRFGEAEALRERLGLLAEAWVLGPFDAQGRGGLDRAFAVETELPNLVPKESTTYSGKERAISWRRMPAQAFVQGALVVDAAVRPDNDAVAYLVTYVRSDRDRSVALRVGSPGPVKAWLGGNLVLSEDAVRPADFDQDAAPMYLRKGDNLLVIKTVITRGAWRLFVRVTDPDGRPVAGVSTSAAVPQEPVHSGKPPAARPVRELGKLLRDRAHGRQKGEPAARAWLDYARFLSLVSPTDVELRAAEEAAKQAVSLAKRPETAKDARLLLGDLSREDDDRRAALEAALPDIRSSEERALALAGIGQLWHRQRRDAEAIARWREAVAVDPACIPAQLALARKEQQAGMPAAALARLESLPKDARELPVVRAALADVLLGLDRRADSESAYRTLFEAQRTDTTVIRNLALAARSRGDLKAAAQLYAETARWRPDLVSPVLDEATALEGLGDLAGARAVLAAAVARLPDDASLPEELGRLEARAGRVSEAAANMRRSLELRPQNPGLRRYLEALVAEAKKKESRSIDGLVAANAADAEALAREALSAPQSLTDAASAEVLLDRTVVRVHGNGLSERFVQRVVHLRTDRAATDSRESWIRYEPGRQEVDVRKARVLRRGKDGTIETTEATERDERDLSEPWYGLYYDSRAEVVVFENLRAGDVVEIQYSVADVSYANELSDYFGDFQLIADTFPTRRWDYTLIAPKDRAIYFNAPKWKHWDGSKAEDSSVLFQKEEGKGETLYRFAANQVARVESEPAMPGAAEVAPYLHVSTYRDWEDVGRWYWNLVVDQMQDDGTLKKAAMAATAGLSSTLDKVKAIHRLVVEKTRYVGLEFGIHGYKPYKATQVLQRGFGDCKDKASLLVTLLRTIGIQSEMVLLRTRRGGRIDDKPASLAVFDHAIAYVPALDLYLDGTAEFSGLAELPSEDQDVMALRVSGKGATLVRTPELDAGTNRAQRAWTVDLLKDGAAKITEDVTISGQAAHEWRERYQTAGEWRERYAKVWNGRYAGSVLDQVEMALADRNRPVSVHAVVRVPRLGERQASGQQGGEPSEAYQIELPLSSREADFTSTYARLGRRQWPLVLGYPWRHEEDVLYRLPDGARIVRGPASQKIESRFGAFTLTLDEERPGMAAVKTTLVVDKSRIAPTDYADFRAFLRKTDALLTERLVVEVKGTP